MKIIEQKQTKQEPQISLGDVVEHAPFGMYIVDSTFRIVIMNKGSQENAFRNVRPVIGRDFAEAVHILWPKEVAEEIVRLFRHTLKSGDPYYSRNFINPRQDIEVRESYEWELHRITLAARQFGVVCYYFNSTEVRRAEQALRESEQRFRALVTASSNAVYCMSADWGEMRHLDGKAFMADTTSPSTTWIDKYIYPDDRSHVMAAIREAIRTKSTFQREHRVWRIDGSVGWTYSQAVPLLNERGEITEWFGAAADITRRKLAEEAAMKSEKMAAAGQLAASLAHEVNNPLSSVTNALYLLSTHSNLNGEARDLVRMAANELARVTRIVKQSLSYYRVGVVPRQVDLAAIVEDSLHIFGERLQRESIRIRKKIVPDTIIVGFPDEIRQVIDNLLLNAMEATAEDGMITISVQPSRNWKVNERSVQLIIGDNGCGIPPQSLADIFKPFFTTKAEKGTGLGLWVVHGIVAKHEGRIKIRSTEKDGRHGTVVSILWPIGGKARQWSESAA